MPATASGPNTANKPDGCKSRHFWCLDFCCKTLGRNCSRSLNSNCRPKRRLSLDKLNWISAILVTHRRPISSFGAKPIGAREWREFAVCGRLLALKYKLSSAAAWHNWLLITVSKQANFSQFQASQPSLIKWICQLTWACLDSTIQLTWCSHN